jgi:hypothetical protein
MHTVELLEEAIDLAKQWGFAVREEWLDGARAGVCQFKGRTWIFIDLSLAPQEQLSNVLAALRSVPNPPQSMLSPALEKILTIPKAA